MRKTIIVLFLSIFLCLLGCQSIQIRDTATPSNCWFATDTPLESRSVSFENITGEKGKGGMAENALGVGRKGKAYIWLEPGETVTIFDVDGPGVIRHIWMVPSITMQTEHDRQILLGLTIRAYWEHQDHPSIQAPVGNFMGIAHGKTAAYESVVHSVNPKAGMNIWAPMPFREHARITITNESPLKTRLFFNIDYTINDFLSKKFGRLHVHYRRENPTTLREDFALMPKRFGQGRYLGTLVGVRLLGPHWWGEGEFKVYLDGDDDFPTIVGSGTEDYIGQSYGVQDKSYLHAGLPLNKSGLVTFYRWHDLDPIYWKQDIRATIQQIGNRKGYYERQDDWNATTFWYEPIPSKPLPELIDYSKRIEDYEPDIIRVPHAIEAEKMKILTSSGGSTAKRDTLKFWGTWSDNHHLLWSGIEQGDRITFEIPVRQDGWYEMNGVFTMSRSGPVLNVYWDDELIKEGIDLYEWSWMPTGKVHLDSGQLTKGLHRLTLEVAQPNPDALKPYIAGFDYIQLDPMN